MSTDKPAAPRRRTRKSLLQHVSAAALTSPAMAAAIAAGGVMLYSRPGFGQTSTHSIDMMQTATGPDGIYVLGANATITNNTGATVTSTNNRGIVASGGDARITNAGTVIVPHISGEWRHEFADTFGTVEANFVGVPASRFTTKGVEPGRDTVSVGGGVELGENNWRIFLDYQADLREDSHNQMLRAGAKLLF